jgi:hypothetical protein
VVLNRELEVGEGNGDKRRHNHQPEGLGG